MGDRAPSVQLDETGHSPALQCAATCNQVSCSISGSRSCCCPAPLPTWRGIRSWWLNRQAPLATK